MKGDTDLQSSLFLILWYLAFLLPAAVHSGAKKNYKPCILLTGVQFLQLCPDVICNPICYLVSQNSYQHFRFQCAFSRLNICVFTYVTLTELPFHCSWSNLKLLFPAHTASPFPLYPFGAVFNCHWCSQILSLSGFIWKFNYEAMPSLASFHFTVKMLIMYSFSTRHHGLQRHMRHDLL